MTFLNQLDNKQILILGFGREGQDTFSFLRARFPSQKILITDKLSRSELSNAAQKILATDPNLTFYSGKPYLESLSHSDIIFKTPGIPLYLPEIQTALREGKTITSNTNLFFELCPGDIIGVTGTKGKSTTASLIAHILKTAIKDVRLVGNIGQPALSALDGSGRNTIFVYELSSFQLQTLKQSPHIAVVLQVLSEHLDQHLSLAEYIAAKGSIASHQTSADYIIFNQASKVARSIARKSPAQKLPYRQDKPVSPGCYTLDSTIFYSSTSSQSEPIISTSDIPLPGKFNLDNVMPSILVAKIHHILTHIICKALTSFIPLEHRLEPVGTFKGITFYNDSISTTPIATIAALETLGKNVATLLLGGSERYHDYSQLARVILASQVKTVILFPTTGPQIWQAINKFKGNNTLPQPLFASNMQAAVKLAYLHTGKNKICLLSPASPSFNLFRDYTERGNLFKRLVQSQVKP